MWKGIPVFADGMFQTKILVRFPRTHLWYLYFVFFCFLIGCCCCCGRFAVKGTGLYKRWMRFLDEIYQSWICHQPNACVNGKQPLFCLMNRLLLWRPRYRRSCYGHYNYAISTLAKCSMSSKNVHWTSIRLHVFFFFVLFRFVLIFVCLFVCFFAVQDFPDRTEYPLCRKCFCCDAPLDAEIKVFFNFGNGLKKEEKAVRMSVASTTLTKKLQSKLSFSLLHSSTNEYLLTLGSTSKIYNILILVLGKLFFLF